MIGAHSIEWVHLVLPWAVSLAEDSFMFFAMTMSRQALAAIHDAVQHLPPHLQMAANTGYGISIVSPSGLEDTTYELPTTFPNHDGIHLHDDNPATSLPGALMASPVTLRFSAATRTRSFTNGVTSWTSSQQR